MSDGASAQVAGWYYAEGDPVGTHRYWDGTQWQGAPQPVATSVIATVASPKPAEYGPRFVAWVVDALVMIAVLVVGGMVGAVAGYVVADAALILALVVALGFYIYNFVYLMGTTGQTVGKKQQKIKLVDASTGQPVGMGLVIARLFVAGILTRIFLLDVIWILIDDENRRLTDKMFDFDVLEA